MNASAVLRVVNASKSFGATQAVRDVSLEVAPGEVVAVVGENGAGKSTLIRLISGELTADSGEVWVGGRLLTADPHLARKSGVAVIHQELSYVPTTDGCREPDAGSGCHGADFVGSWTVAG